MSSRSLFLSCALFALSATQAMAQTPEIAARRARIDSLLPQVRAAHVQVLRDDSLRKARELAADLEPLDTVSIPPFTVIVRRREARETSAAFRWAIEPWRETLRGFSPDSGLVLAVEWAKDPYRPLQLLANARGYRMVSLYGANAGRRRQSAISAVADALTPFLPDNVQAWLKGASLSSGLDDANVYRQIATSPSAYATGCLKHVAVDCMKALGLRDVEPMQGYSASKIIQFAIDRAGYYDADLHAECVRDRAVASCLRLLESTGGVPAALAGSARSNLLLFVLERGGVGAFPRLVEQEGVSALDAVAVTGGSNTESLIAGWRADVGRAISPTRAGLPGAVAGSVFWSVVALTFALRSTRRRVE